MKVLIVLNDAPYGSERSYNGLRLAGSLAKQEGTAVDVFLAGDAAPCARSGQKVPNGFYNVGTMLTSVSQRGGRIGVCGTCMDARPRRVGLIAGSHRSTDEWTARRWRPTKSWSSSQGRIHVAHRLDPRRSRWRVAANRLSRLAERRSHHRRRPPR